MKTNASSWRIGASRGGRWCAMLLAAGWVLAAVPAQAWTLAVFPDPASGGTATAPTTTGTGTNTVVIWATSAGTDWKFVRWYGDTGGLQLDPTNSLNRVAMTNDDVVVLGALFVNTAPRYNLTVLSGVGGSTDPMGTVSNLVKDWFTIAAIPTNSTEPAYLFDKWTGANVETPSAANTRVYMDNNKTITANFKRQWTYVGYEASGPGTPSFTTNLLEGVSYRAQVLDPIVPINPTKRSVCNGWTDGAGMPVNGALNYYGPYTVAASATNRWTWTNEYRIIVTASVGADVVDHLGTNWFTQGEVLDIDAKALPGYEFLGWTIDVTSNVPPGAIQITVDRQHTILASFGAVGSDSDGDGLPDAWEKQFGLNASSSVGQDGKYGDPDGDGLSNFEEFKLQNTNRNWYASPINADSDGDGMDDYYERYSIDPTNITADEARDFISAVIDPGAYKIDNGPLGNPDKDYKWNTATGYRMTAWPLRNIDEWRGPDGIDPVTYATVSWGDPGYPFATDHGKPVKIRVPALPVGGTYGNFRNPLDTDDQSRGNVKDSDGDTFDDGFEYSWDQWQQTNSGMEEPFVVGVSSGVTYSVTNTVPVWDGAANTTRRFNPNKEHVDPAGLTGAPDNDVLYDFKTGGVSPYWYSDLLEYNASQTNVFSAGIADAPHEIRRDQPPTPDNPPRCSHPFLMDVDHDGLPDGYEVIFGYDPWVAQSQGSVGSDAADNPDDDWMAQEGEFRHHEIYVAEGFDPRTGWGQRYPTRNQMPGAGASAAPNSARYSNIEEMRGPDGMMVLTPRASIIVNTDDATHPFKPDSDGDGIWDGWEAYVGLNPNDPVDGGLDADSDGVANVDEFRSFLTSSTNRAALTPLPEWLNKIFPTDPHEGDTDGDGIDDGGEKGAFNGSLTSAMSNSVLDANGNIVTQVFVVGAWNGACYTGGGLMPTSSDTDGDTMPDPYEVTFSGAIDGTAGDAFADPDGDGLQNYQEYMTAATYHWQYDFWLAGQVSYDSGDFFFGTPKPWDWSGLSYIPMIDGGGPYAYSSTSPGSVDSDGDGMDDYYEIYHGLNPTYGIIDLVASRIAGVELNIATAVADPRIQPYVNGSPFMDSDGDGLPNDKEAVTFINSQRAPTYHTDPSPLWITDFSYPNSWVNLYYVPGSIWYWSGPLPPPTYAFSFESNEGFDTDNDNVGDFPELQHTDPLSWESPIKRRALYLPAGQDAYARTLPSYWHNFEALRSFTVEAWVRPLSPVSGQPQVVVERAFMLPIGNQMGLTPGLRVNFRLAVDTNGVPYVEYTGEGDPVIFYQSRAESASPLRTNTWTHLAATYQVASPELGTRGKLKLYVNGALASSSVPNELPAIGRFGNGDTVFVYPAPLMVGAAEANPAGKILGGGEAPAPYNFFKGWVDEVRVWDGARSQSEIATGMRHAMKQADVQAAIARNASSTNGVVSRLYYLFGFDDLPDPDHSPVSPEGFDVVMMNNRPADWNFVSWWATATERSLRYTDYMYIPWIGNPAAHLPEVPPVDIGDPLGKVTPLGYPNTMNPYGLRYFTAPAKPLEIYPFKSMTGAIIDGTSPLFADLLPCRWAVADEDIPMWDDGTTPAIDSLDSDGDGMPDYWEELYGLDPLSVAGTDGGEGDLDADGLNNLNEYLTGNSPINQDSDGNGISDADEDSDGDHLSNAIEADYYGTNPGDPDTDDDGISDGMEVDRQYAKADGRLVTSPVDSRSPLMPKSMLANGVPLVLPPRGSLSDLDRFDLQNWTLEAWVKPQSASETGSLLLRTLVDGRTNFALRLENNRPVIEFTTVSGVGYKEKAASPIPSNTWTHLAGVLSSDSLRFSLYVNGLIVTNFVVADACATGEGVTTMGDGIHGAIDDIRIWSIERNSSEIRTWYDKTYRDESLKVKDIITVTVYSNNAASILMDALLAGTSVPSGIKDLTATLSGANLAAGVFEGFPVLPNGMPRPAKGVILSSGNVKDAELRSNTSGSKTTSFGTPGDGDLSLLAGGGDTHDAVALTLTFWSDVSVKGVTFDFVFGSEEFPEWVGTAFNDDFGAFLDGVNIAFDRQGLPVSVNNNFFELNNDIWNTGNLATAGKQRVVLPFEYDGLTPLLTTSKALKPGFHTLKFVIADTGDSVLDSAVFLSHFRFRLETEGTGKSMKDLRSYYMFDDGQNTTLTNKLTGKVTGHGAEDFSYVLDWKFALTGCVFSATNNVAPLVELKNDQDADGLPDWWEALYFGMDVAPDEDSDGDGLENLYEFWAGTDPDVWDTDSDGFSDYDSRKGPGERTYGERFDDGDGMPDIWENLHSGPCQTTGKSGPDPANYDGNLDPDEDGWSNYSEYLAGTDPVSADSVPRPTLAIHARYHGLWGNTLPDAFTTRGVTTVVVAGELATTASPGAVYLVGILQNGGITPGTAKFTAGTGLNVQDNSAGTLTGTYSGGTVSGGINYETGGWFMTLAGAGFAANTPINVGYSYKTGGQLKLLFYKNAAMDTLPVASLEMDGDVLNTSTFVGHLVEGNNYAFAYLDRNSNKRYDPDSEPAGLAQFNPINVGLGTVNNVEFGLSDSMPGYPRMSWPDVVGVSQYCITNSTAPAFSKNIRGRNYWHEGDWLSVGTYGANAGSVVLLISTNVPMVGYYTNVVATVPTVTLGTPVVTTPHDTVFTYARNEVEFKVDPNATSYRLQVSATSNGTVILSTTNIVPYRDLDGVSKTRLPFYAGDNYALTAGSLATSVWANGRYWIRVQAATPAASVVSTWSAINLDLRTPAQGGQSMIAGDLYYFGKVAHGYGAGQTNQLTMIVQAFKSDGFSGEPEAQVQVAYQCNTNQPSAKKGVYNLLGLHSGKYVVRAFIDVNGDRKLDSFEPMGMVQLLSSDGGYRPQVIDLTDSASVSATAMRVIIRDRDTDNDQLPDGWEWMYYGSLSRGAYDISASTNLTLLRCYEIEPLDLNPTITDYDGDGLEDFFEITYNDRVAGRALDVNHYDPYDPVSNPHGTDLNPTKWDTDGDGLSDGYEVAHGLDPLNASTDRNGVTDLQKVLASGVGVEEIPGVLRVSQVASVTPADGAFSLTWSGQVGNMYQVQYSDDLQTWRDVPGATYYGAGDHLYMDQSPVVATRFYRVKAQ